MTEESKTKVLKAIQTITSVVEASSFDNSKASNAQTIDRILNSKGWILYLHFIFLFFFLPDVFSIWPLNLWTADLIDCIAQTSDAMPPILRLLKSIMLLMKSIAALMMSIFFLVVYLKIPNRK